jgi:hypothetical protein
MAPVLFSFLMQALPETLEKERKKNNVTILESRHFPNPGKGRLLGQDRRAKGKTFELFHLLRARHDQGQQTNLKQHDAKMRIDHAAWRGQMNLQMKGSSTGCIHQTQVKLRSQ